MKKLNYIVLIFLISFTGCEKSNIVNMKDPDYPTKIKKIDYDLLERMRSDLSNRYKYLYSTVNDFGFCDYPEELIDVPTPPLKAISATEAAAIAKNFLYQNSLYTGVDYITDHGFIKADSSSGYWDGSTIWHMLTSLQKIDTIEVLSTNIMLNIRSGEVVSCVGNWYHGIYIPEKFNFNSSDTRHKLVDKVMTHYTIAGQPYYVKITGESLDRSATRLVIVPLLVNDTIELHIAWQINIPSPVYYIICIDVMSGEIISQSPTIIS